MSDQNRTARQPLEWTDPTEWTSYFQRNSGTLIEIPWGSGPRLNSEQKQALSKSIQTFQLGECGEGLHFQKVAKRRAALTQASEDIEYLKSLRLFIGEEQRHAGDLARFLEQEGIPLIKKDWTDGLFRRLRHMAGLELIVAVLVTAEIIAKVYYAAIRRTSDSPSLIRLCEQILRDEVQHIRFQCERLAQLRRDRHPWRNRLVEFAGRILFSGTCLVVWKTHRSALRAGGLTFSAFWKSAHAEWSVARRLMRPESYELAEDSKVVDSTAMRRIRLSARPVS